MNQCLNQADCSRRKNESPCLVLACHGAAAKAETDRLAAEKESKRGGADTITDPITEMGGIEDRDAVRNGESRPIRSGKKSGKKGDAAQA